MFATSKFPRLKNVCVHKNRHIINITCLNQHQIVIKDWKLQYKRKRGVQGCFRTEVPHSGGTSESLEDTNQKDKSK